MNTRRVEEEQDVQEAPRKIVKKASESNPGAKSNLL